MFLRFLFGHIAQTSADDIYTDTLGSHERQEYRQALPKVVRLATTGDADTQSMLGQMHEAGQGPLRVFVEAQRGTTWPRLVASEMPPLRAMPVDFTEKLVNELDATKAKKSLSTRASLRKIPRSPIPDRWPLGVSQSTTGHHPRSLRKSLPAVVPGHRVSSSTPVPPRPDHLCCSQTLGLNRFFAAHPRSLHYGRRE
ncbi:hypothetical protein FEI13_18360 [Halomonas urmiana]|uniref:Uncharacterized protein n=1 Tax=Halomonas urmiana TaxID=490901 RepID=A0A5R8M6B7_9GAMM|nr:hypothetical protein [Halomonas urmiana]TLF45118.1 hypothetical protein FEI13_18360 [Halomonas urmiana]